MLWKVQLKLDLLAAGNASLETVRTFDDAPDQAVVAVVERKLEFAVDDKV